MPSAWQGAAQGLESGFRMAMQLDQQQRSNRRQDAADARQAGLDAQAQEDRQRTFERQQLSDTAGAVQAQGADLVSSLQARINRGETLTKAEQADWAASYKANQEARQQVLTQRGAPDLDAIKAARAERAQKVAAGTATPDELATYLKEGTGINAADWVRPAPDQPSPIEANGGRMIQAFDKGDQAGIIKGLNYALAPQINQGVGEQTGRGKVLKKEIDSVVPVPTVGPDGQPTPPGQDAGPPTHGIVNLKVWVNNGKAGPTLPPESGAPPGVTGYYIAPLTEGRGSGPDARPLPVSFDKVKDYISNQMQLAQHLNESPDAQAKLQEYVDTHGDDENFSKLAASAGITPRKKQFEDVTIKAGEKRLRYQVEADGNRIGEPQVLDNPKEFRDPLDAARQIMEDNPGMSLVDAAALAQRVGLARQPTKYSGGGLAGPGGGGGAGGGGAGSGSVGLDSFTPGQRRYYQTTKELIDKKEEQIAKREAEADQNYRAELTTLKDDPLTSTDESRAQNKADRAALKKEYEARRAKFDQDREGIAQNRADLERRTGLKGTDDVKASKPQQPGKGKLTADAAATKFGF